MQLHLEMINDEWKNFRSNELLAPTNIHEQAIRSKHCSLHSQLLIKFTRPTLSIALVLLLFHPTRGVIS